jgi:uncharacterized protein (DUF433 family)
MDAEVKKARDLLAEFQEDYGTVPSWKVEDVLRMLRRGYSLEDIDEAYRDHSLVLRKVVQEEAYDKLNGLREEYGRCSLVKVDTVLVWMKANDTDDEMKAKYRQRVERVGNQERAQRINARIVNDAGIYSFHTMDQILDALQSFGHESDAQIIYHVNDAIYPGFSAGLFGPGMT